MKHKEQAVIYGPSLKTTIGAKNYHVLLLHVYLLTLFGLNVYYFGFPKALLVHIIFFSLLIFPFAVYQYFKAKGKTLTQRLDLFGFRILIFYLYTLICQLTFHVYFWSMGQPIVYYFFVTDLVLILLCLFGSYIFHSEYLFTKWYQKNVKIDGNKVFFKNLSYISSAYEKPKNFILAKIRSIFVAIAMLIFLGLSGVAALGGAVFPVLSRIVGGAFTSQLDPVYFIMYGLKIIFLVICASIIYPTMYYCVWWRATRKGIVEKYGSIEIDCSDVDVIRYR